MALLSRPSSGMENEKFSLLDGGFTVFLLFLLTIIQKILWRVLTKEALTFSSIAAPVFLACCIGWGGLTSLFYGIGRLRKSEMNFYQIAGYTGVAALPLIITTLFSIILIILEFIFKSPPGSGVWLQMQNILGWIGVALGWPGYFSGLALHASTGMKKTSAMIIALVLTLLFMIGWWLPSSTIHL